MEGVLLFITQMVILLRLREVLLTLATTLEL